MRIIGVTWLLIAALAIRLLAAIFRLDSDIGGLLALNDVFYHPGVGRSSARVLGWALNEFPQIAINMVDVIWVQGLYEVWRRLRAARLRRMQVA